MELTDDQIADVDIYRHHVGVPRSKALAAWACAKKRADVRILRSGDSLLVLQDLGQGLGEFHYVNAAPFEDFVRNVVATMTQVKALGFKEIYTLFKNPAIVEVAKRTPFDARVEPLDSETYKMIVRL